MIEAEFRRVQRLPSERLRSEAGRRIEGKPRFPPDAAIERIPDEGPPGIREMGADLVCPSRVKLDLQQRHRCRAVDHAQRRHRAPPGPDLRGEALPIYWMSSRVYRGCGVPGGSRAPAPGSVSPRCAL